MTSVLTGELSRFTELRRRLIEADEGYDQSTFIEVLECVTDLHDAIRAAVRSALEDEETASRLRGRLDEMEAGLRRVEKRAEGKREAALLAMIEAGLEELEEPGLRIAVRRAPPVIVVSDESLIPEAYRIPQPEWIDYRAIRAVLTGGGGVPGAEFAGPEPYLSVRTG